MKYGRGNSMVGSNQATSGAYGNVTTDHNGHILQVRTGAVPIQHAVTTTVTITEGDNLPRPIDRIINVAHTENTSVFSDGKSKGN